MTVVLHLSDLHFGTERPAVVEGLARLTQGLAPNLLILSGDLTQRARRAQFKAARAFVDRLGVPAMLAIPGNHDIPLFNLAARVLSPYGNFQRVFGEDLEPVFDAAALLVIGVNTTRAYRHKRGELSAAQIERVAQRLEGAAATQLRIVVTHQPIAVARDTDRANLLQGRDAAIARWSRAGADFILGGHVHLPCVVALHERTGADALPRRLWAVQAGTALSSRLRFQVNNSVNVIRYDGTSQPAVVERWDFSDARACFESVAIHELHVDRGGGG